MKKIFLRLQVVGVKIMMNVRGRITAGVLGSDLEDALVLCHGFVDCLAFGVEVGNWLLAVDVLAVTEGLHADDSVPVIRSGDHDCVDVIASTQFAEIKVGLAVLVAVFLVDGFLASHRATPAVAVRMVHVTVSNCDALDVLVIDMGLHHAEATVSNADEAHDDTFTGSGFPILAKGTGWNDGGKANGSASGG